MSFYVLPGVRDALRLFNRTANIRFSFFSAGTEGRNRELVDKLLEETFGKEYEQIKQKVTILSRQDMMPARHDEAQRDCNQCGFLHGLRRKDISKVLREGELLENAVLFDDVRQNIPYTQHKNYLYVPEPKYERCDEDRAEDYIEGVKKTLVFLSPTPEIDKKFVENGQEILVIPKQGQYEIHYLHEETNKRQVCILSKRHYSDMIKELAQLQRSRVGSNDVFVVESEQLVKKLMDVIVPLGAKTSKICRSINRIYYATGLFFYALELSQNTGRPITDCLFELQCAKEENQKVYRPYERSVKHEKFYHIGLKKLQEVNPSLQFLALNLPESSEVESSGEE